MIASITLFMMAVSQFAIVCFYEEDKGGRAVRLVIGAWLVLAGILNLIGR